VVAFAVWVRTRVAPLTMSIRYPYLVTVG